MVAAVVVLLGIVVATPSSAQATFVTVKVRTTPALPQPGDDVSVKVRIQGCSPGPALVQIYLTSDDGATVAATLMAQQDAGTSLMWRTVSEIALPQAIEGWYGIRVVCGAFRPARAPMANTFFAVGANPTKQSRLLATSVAPGGTLRMEGNGCPGPTVEYDVGQSGTTTGGFRASGNIPVGPDGTWGGDIQFPANLVPGTAQVRSRCVFQTAAGDTVYINYGGGTEVTVTG